MITFLTIQHEHPAGCIKVLYKTGDNSLSVSADKMADAMTDNTACPRGFCFYQLEGFS
jgi:hypothetical protein